MGSGVGDRIATGCRSFAREAALRWGAWAKPDPSKPRVPFRTRMERFNKAWDGHLTEGERSIHNFKRTMTIAGSAFTAATAMHIFYKEITRVQGPDGSPADPDASYERARRAVFLFLHRVDPGSFPSPEDPALRLVQLWKTYYEELFGKPSEKEAENKEEALETARITAEAQALISQTLGKLQAEQPSKTEADAVLFLVTKHREASIREGALESLLDRQMHRNAAQPRDAYDLSLLTEQREARVRAAAISALRKQLQQRRTARATEGQRKRFRSLEIIAKMCSDLVAVAEAHAMRESEAAEGSQPGSDAEAHAKGPSEAAKGSQPGDGTAGMASEGDKRSQSGYDGPSNESLRVPSKWLTRTLSPLVALALAKRTREAARGSQPGDGTSESAAEGLSKRASEAPRGSKPGDGTEGTA